MAPPRCVIDPAATTNRANRVYNRHSARGGDDDPRRGNSLPREGLQLCVAPYFATRGRGDMRGGRGGVPPNRTPEVVRGCRFHHGVACNVLCIMGVARRVVWRDDGLPPPPGWHFGGAHRWSPHVADTQVGEIRGYARLPSPPGIDNTSPLRKRCAEAQVRG